MLFDPSIQVKIKLSGQNSLGYEISIKLFGNFHSELSRFFPQKVILGIGSDLVIPLSIKSTNEVYKS